VLCFSPVGSALRVRSRKFPALANCTNIDWFHEWPEEALLSVSQKFLSEVDLLTVKMSPTCELRVRNATPSGEQFIDGITGEKFLRLKIAVVNLIFDCYSVILLCINVLLYFRDLSHSPPCIKFDTAVRLAHVKLRTHY